MKSLLWFLGLSVIALSILWTFGAVKAGLFVRHAQVFASRVHENSIEPFSRDKSSPLCHIIDVWSVTTMTERDREM